MHVRGIVSLVLLLLACVSVARADERILSYNSTITVQRDGSLAVHETIRVRAEGQAIKRGIYRDFPTVYTGQNGRPFIVGFDFRSAARDGASEMWHTEKGSNGVRIYIGSPNVKVSKGEHTYEIDYHTDRQLGFFADHDEVYWNVTGNGWDFPIDTASARVVLPDAVPQTEIRLEAYTGSQGAKGKAYTARLDAGTPFFTTSQGLGRHEGLTVVVMWPKGFVVPSVENPTTPPENNGWSPANGTLQPMAAPEQRSGPVIRDARPALFGIGGVALLLLYYAFIWNRVGRDPPGRVVIPEYEPPEGVWPGGMRYLTQMEYDDRCFAADILALAVAGHITIEEDKVGLLNLKKEYTLIRRRSAATKPPTSEEQLLLNALGLVNERDSLELKQANHVKIRAAKNTHRSRLVKRFTPSFFSVNSGWHFLGILWTIVIVIALVISVDRYVRIEWYFTTPLGLFTVACALTAVIANGVFARLLKAPTVSGRAAMDKIAGFRKYLEVAESQELQRLEKPPPAITPELYYGYLPAALALGVEQHWAQRFAKLFAEQPDRVAPGWYSGSGFDARHMSSFSSNLGSALSSSISSSSTAPGSSSGGGGGGSSGGGGGGGGGGGW